MLWRPGPVEFSDLLSAAQLGLCEAARDYDPGRSDMEFEQYAVTVCWHRVTDALRNADTLSRGDRKRWRRREAGEAEAPRTSKERYVAAAIQNAQSVSLDAFLLEGARIELPSAEDVASDVCDRVAIERMRVLVRAMPPRLRLVYLRLVQDVSQEDIARELGLSGSRVCQLRSEIVQRLAAEMAPEVQSRGA